MTIQKLATGQELKHIKVRSPYRIFTAFFNPELANNIKEFSESAGCEVWEFSAKEDLWVAPTLITIIDREYYGIAGWEEFVELYQDYEIAPIITLDGLSNLKMPSKWKSFNINPQDSGSLEKIKSLIWKGKIMKERIISDQDAMYSALEDMMNDEEKKYDRFVKDGIVDYNVFYSQPLKVLWILKETNDPEGKTKDLRDFLRTPASYPKWKSTWLPVLQISYGLTNYRLEDGGMDNYDELQSEFEADEKNDFYSFKKIAAININKTPGDKSIGYKELKECYLKYRGYILSQIKLIDPHVIICCGTFWVMWEELYNLKMGIDETNYKEKILNVTDKKGNKLDNIKNHFNNRRIYVETYHPNQRKITHKAYYEPIVHEVKGWIEQHKQPHGRD